MVVIKRETRIGAWAFLVGVILALLVGVVAPPKIAAWIQITLGILGLVVGYFVSEKDTQTFLIASVSLVLVSYAGIQGMVLNAAIAGSDLIQTMSSILGALLNLFVPATIVVAIKSVFSISKI